MSIDFSSLLTFLSQLLPPEQISQLFLIVGGVLGATQIIKIGLNNFNWWRGRPAVRHCVVHYTSVVAALVLSFGMWPVPMWQSKLAVAAICWSLAYLIATYTLRAMSIYTPRLFKIVQCDGRKR